MNLELKSMNSPVIEIVDLNKSFGDHQVLYNISLNLSEDENLVVLGRSGTGKSVLIKCIVGLEKADSGSIVVLGNSIINMDEFSLNELRKQIGFLFQGGALYDSMSVEENLLFPLKRNAPGLSETEKNYLVDDVLDSVGLLDAKFKMPSELSGGMKKRAGLARTLVLQPKVILYDEPTTGLDPFTAQGISELIIKVKERYKTAAIIVTHDMKCARATSDRLIIMDDGKIIAKGKFTEVQQIENKTIQGFFK
jgi:phospholipid/cholesterol/gamma-HCH transport system ATP-binding protein